MGLGRELLGAQLEGRNHFRATLLSEFKPVGEKHDLADQSVVGNLRRYYAVSVVTSRQFSMAISMKGHIKVDMKASLYWYESRYANEYRTKYGQ